MTFNLKQNDTSPQISAILQDGAGTAIDLTGANVRFHMKRIGAATASVDANATIVNDNAGSVKYVWISADTSVAGTYQAEFEVTYTDGSVETFPNDTSIAIEIVEDLA
jgi:Rib/alpha/Esp surface antigen-like repeat protein